MTDADTNSARRWLFLAAAIVLEVAGPLSLKGALTVPALYLVVALGYAGAFVFLALTLRARMPLGVAYGIWGAAGVVLTAVLSALIFAEPLTPLMGAGIAIIIAGVLCVELGAQRARTEHVGGGLVTAWAYLVVAIVCELAATLSLRKAVDDRRWYLAVAPGYLAAFALLSLTLAAGMPLGVAYGIWTAAGVALAAVASRLLFREPLSPLMGAGIVMIGIGVVLVEWGSTA